MYKNGTNSTTIWIGNTSERHIRLSCQLPVPVHSLCISCISSYVCVTEIRICENMNDFEVTNKILYHFVYTRFSNGGSVNITVSCWMTDWFLSTGWNKKSANFESKWSKEFFFNWSRFFIRYAFDVDCHFISRLICKFISSY